MRPTGTYTTWSWPPPGRGYDEMAWTVTPETDPTPDGYFWAHQIAFVGGPAAYAGLQTVGAAPAGKIAIFSAWDALGADGEAYAAPFGGEGTGWSVRIPFEWRPEGTYSLRIARAERPGGPGSWWEATVDGRRVGAIRVPDGWGGLAGVSIMWTERYAGPLRACADLAYASAVFGEPAAGAVRPLSHRNHLGVPPGCPGSSAEDLASGPEGVSVRHVMGARPVR